VGQGRENRWGKLVRSDSIPRSPQVINQATKDPDFELSGTEGGPQKSECQEGGADMEEREIDETSCEIEGITVTGSDPCPDPESYWDDLLGRCVYPESDPTPPPPSDENEPSGGGYDGSNDDDSAGIEGHAEWDAWELECREGIDPGCVLRYLTDWTTTEAQRVAEAIDDIGARCPTEGAALQAMGTQIGLWDARVLRGPDTNDVLYGRTDQVTGHILVWTGYNAEPGDNVNWTRTLAHEIGHVIDDSRTHQAIYDRADYCAGLAG